LDLTHVSLYNYSSLCTEYSNAKFGCSRQEQQCVIEEASRPDEEFYEPFVESNHENSLELDSLPYIWQRNATPDNALLSPLSICLGTGKARNNNGKRRRTRGTKLPILDWIRKYGLYPSLDHMKVLAAVAKTSVKSLQFAFRNFRARKLSRSTGPEVLRSR